MQPLVQRAKARDQYIATALSSRIEASGPHGLVLMLYEELARNIEVIAACMARPDGVNSRTYVQKAQEIFLSLEAGLDLEGGGALAQQLAGIYRAMRKELQRCVAAHDREGLATLTEGLESMTASWRSIAA